MASEKRIKETAVYSVTWDQFSMLYKFYPFNGFKVLEV